MHSRSSAVIGRFQPQRRVSRLQGCWVSLLFDVATVGRTATEATHSERTHESMQEFVRTTEPLCARNKKKSDDSSTHLRAPLVLVPHKANFATSPAWQPMVAMRQRSRTRSEGVACVKMWVVTFRHTSFSDSLKLLARNSSRMAFQCAGNVPLVAFQTASRGLSPCCQK